MPFAVTQCTIRMLHSGLVFLCSTCNWKQKSWHLILTLPYLFSTWKLKFCVFEITIQRPLRNIKNKLNNTGLKICGFGFQQSQPLKSNLYSASFHEVHSWAVQKVQEGLRNRALSEIYFHLFGTSICETVYTESRLVFKLPMDQKILLFLLSSRTSIRKTCQSFFRMIPWKIMFEKCGRVTF